MYLLNLLAEMCLTGGFHWPTPPQNQVGSSMVSDTTGSRPPYLAQFYFPTTTLKFAPNKTKGESLLQFDLILDTTSDCDYLLGLTIAEFSEKFAFSIFLVREFWACVDINGICVPQCYGLTGKVNQRGNSVEVNCHTFHQLAGGREIIVNCRNEN